MRIAPEKWSNSGEGFRDESCACHLTLQSLGPRTGVRSLVSVAPTAHLSMLCGWSCVDPAHCPPPHASVLLQVRGCEVRVVVGLLGAEPLALPRTCLDAMRLSWVENSTADLNAAPLPLFFSWWA